MYKTIRKYADVAHPNTIGIISLGHGVNEFGAIILPPVIPLLVSDLGISYAQSGLLISVYFAMTAIFQLPAGVFANDIGKKRLLVIGFATMTAGIFLASMALSFEMLVLAQIIAGIGGSTFHPVGMSLISDIETQNTEGRAMGIFGFGGIVGTMASPVLVGGLAAVTGWRIAVGCGVILGLLVTLVFVFGFNESKYSSSENTTDLELENASSATPVDRVQAIVDTVKFPYSADILAVILMMGLVGLQIRAIQTFTTSYVTQATDGLTSVGNLSFFALLLGGSLSSLLVGGLADEFDRGFLGVFAAIATTILVGATFFVTNVIGYFSPIVAISLLVIWFFLIGMMMYASAPLVHTLSSEYAEEEFSGSLFGVIQTTGAIGNATGPAILGVLAGRFGLIAVFPVIMVVSIALAGVFVSLSSMN